MYGRFGLSPFFGKGDSGRIRQGFTQAPTMGINIHTPGDRLPILQQIREIFPAQWVSQFRTVQMKPGNEGFAPLSNTRGNRQQLQHDWLLIHI